MTLRDLVDKCYGDDGHWAEIIVFGSEEDIEKFVDDGNELGIQFTIKGEYSMAPFRREILDSEVECFYPIAKNVIAVCCLDLFDRRFVDSAAEKEE
jgi:hypothetical protein